ncbi:MAG: hypothetical protein MK025_02330 [Acidobacteriia bacterium]|nr:hypothetical protein [Terriglobia bacterium]
MIVNSGYINPLKHLLGVTVNSVVLEGKWAFPFAKVVNPIFRCVFKQPIQSLFSSLEIQITPN